MLIFYKNISRTSAVSSTNFLYGEKARDTRPPAPGTEMAGQGEDQSNPAPTEQQEEVNSGRQTPDNA